MLAANTGRIEMKPYYEHEGSMKPYYDDGKGIQIYLGDCRDILPELEPVDLVLTDPPYGINYKGFSASKSKGLGLLHDGIIGDSELMDLRFILNMRCGVVSFGANNYPEQLPHKGRWIVWDKRTCAEADRMFGSPFELAWTNRVSGFGNMIRKMHGGAVNADRSGKRLHPTQKPCGLFRSILIDIYPDAQTILDPFMGSGTTLVAAQSLGRKCIGIEIEERYCQIAVDRLRQMPLPLAETISHDRLKEEKQGGLFYGSPTDRGNKTENISGQ